MSYNRLMTTRRNTPQPSGTITSGITDMSDFAFLTVRETAEIMRVSKMTISRMIKAGTLPCTKIGKSHRIPAAAVRAYLEAGTVSPERNTE